MSTAGFFYALNPGWVPNDILRGIPLSLPSWGRRLFFCALMTPAPLRCKRSSFPVSIQARIHSPAGSRLKPIAAFLILLITSSVASAQTTQPANLISPEVHPDRTVTFRVYAPKATQASLFADWVPVGTTRPMTSDGKGIWSITQGPLPPGIYIYTFTVDGITMPDPVNPRIKLRWRTSASTVEVPGDHELWEAGDVPHGKVENQLPEIFGPERNPRRLDLHPSRLLARCVDQIPRPVPVPWLQRHRCRLDNGGGRELHPRQPDRPETRAVPMIVVMPYGHTVPYTACARNNRNRRTTPSSNATSSKTSRR